MLPNFPEDFAPFTMKGIITQIDDFKNLVFTCHDTNTHNEGCAVYDYECKTAILKALEREFANRVGAFPVTKKDERNRPVTEFMYSPSRNELVI
jgi:hypothetical protein